ncbi:MAG: adenylate/guanylate cyclase domain-containing protein, partial [Pseudomonadota bacterium]
RLGPTETVTMLNEYFSVISEILEQNDGVITQFQGDAVLATFNLPIAHPDHAARAVKSAVEIHAAIAERLFAGQKLRCRIGINTGEVVAGNVGAAGRMSYTVHGDAVNVAARLESMNKQLATRVLLSQSTLSSLGGRPVGLREVGELPVRGKSESVTLFTLDIPDASNQSSSDTPSARATQSVAEKAETS